MTQIGYGSDLYFRSCCLEAKHLQRSLSNGPNKISQALDFAIMNLFWIYEPFFLPNYCRFKWQLDICYLLLLNLYLGFITCFISISLNMFTKQFKPLKMNLTPSMPDVMRHKRRCQSLWRDLTSCPVSVFTLIATHLIHPNRTFFHRWLSKYLYASL